MTKFTVMSKIRRKFSKEYKLEIVNRSLDERSSVIEVSEEYGIHVNTLSRWRREFLSSGEAKSFPGNGNEELSSEEREIRSLRKKLQEAELERDILKKAIHVFSKRDGRNTNS